METNIIKFEDTSGVYFKVTGEGEAFLDGEQIELPPVLVAICKRIGEAQKEFGEAATIYGHDVPELNMLHQSLDTNTIIPAPDLTNNEEENAHTAS